MGFFSSNAGSKAAKAIKEQNALAIQELRRQFDITQGNFQPFIEAGTEAIGQVQEGTTVEGLDARLGRIFGTESFQNLRAERERGVRGQLSAGGLTRSGAAVEEIAKVPTDLGLLLEQLLTGRSTNLAASGQDAVAGIGGLGAQASGNIAQLFSDIGRAQSSGIITDASSKTASLQGLLNLGGQTIGAAGAAGGFGALFSGFFSDPRLKVNVVKINQIILPDGNSLGLYKWDWIDTDSEMINMCNPYGFLTTEVKEHFPQHVLEYGGFDAIDYELLIKDLEGDVSLH